MNQAAFVQDVTRRIGVALQGQTPPGLEASAMLDEAGKYLSMAPGAKRARPRLVYGFAQTLDVLGEPDALGQIALAAEFIHGASLLHDDVVDEGTMRRGRPTVNAKWNSSVAVLGGDVMLCLSIQALAQLPRAITNEAVATVATMSRAAILEVETRGQIDLPLDAWEAIARGKTGVLFGWCGRAVALLGGHADVAERFGRCGDHLGVAFQMADDIRDLADQGSGKNRFSDISNRNPSYPLLWAAAHEPALATEIARAWRAPSVGDAAALGEEVLATGALEHTSQEILRQVEAAFDALGPYKESAGAQAIYDWALSLSRTYLGTLSSAG